MISVCVATYNGEKYIREQLESILCQLSANDEIIISDDRSTDATLSIIESFGDSRINVFIHEKVENRYKGTYKNIYYVYKNFENAMRHSSGDVIFLSDQDDIWLPNKVERMMQEIQRGAECVLHNTQVIDSSKGNEVIMVSYFAWSKPSCSRTRFILRCFYQGASMAFTKRILNLSLPFPLTYPISHDHWIAALSWTHGKEIAFIEEPLMLYRRHGANVSPSGERSNNSLYFKISYRFNLLFNYLYSRKR